MDVSIIYVNYKTSQLIIDSISSVVEKTHGISYEIIVVDNNSGDNSFDDIKKAYPEVIYIQSGENLGFGRANNLGINIASGECLFFLNPDTLLMNNAIYILYKYLIDNSNAGACGGNLYNIDNTPTLSFSPVFPCFIQEFLSIFYLPVTLFSKSKSDCFNYTNLPLNVASITGADLMVKKNIINIVGAFDPVFFLNYEETDLCFRIKKAGYKVMSIPNAKIMHFEGKSDYISETRLFFLYQGQYIYYKKWYGNVGTKAIYIITYLKNLIRLIQFVLLNNEKKKKYWRFKKETNYRAFLSFNKKHNL